MTRLLSIFVQGTRKVNQVGSLPKCRRWLAQPIVYIPNRAGSLWSFFHLTLDHGLNYTPSCCKFSDGMCTNALGSTGCWVWTFIGNSLQMQNWKHCHFLLALNCHAATIGDEQEGHQSKVARLPWNNLGSWILLWIKWNILRCRLFAKEASELINLLISAIDWSDYRLDRKPSMTVAKMQGLVRWKTSGNGTCARCAHAYTNKTYGKKTSMIYQIYSFWVLCKRWWWLPWPCFFTGGVFLKEVWPVEAPLSWGTSTQSSCRQFIRRSWRWMVGESWDDMSKMSHSFIWYMFYFGRGFENIWDLNAFSKVDWAVSFAGWLWLVGSHECRIGNDAGKSCDVDDIATGILTQQPFMSTLWVFVKFEMAMATPKPLSCETGRSRFLGPVL